MTQKRSAGCALVQRRNMSQATALGARMRSDSVKNMSAYADQNHAPSLAAARLEFNLTKYEPKKVQIRSLYFFWFGQFLLLKVKHRMFIFLFFLVLDILLPVYLQLRMPLPVFRMENP